MVRSEVAQVRATASWGRSRWLRRRVRTVTYDVRLRDGSEVYDVDLSKALAGMHTTDRSDYVRWARESCPEEGRGDWCGYT